MHQSAKNIVDPAITEVVRKNFTTNISSKNIPAQELQSEKGWALTRTWALTQSNIVLLFLEKMLTVHNKMLILILEHSVFTEISNFSLDLTLNKLVVRI